MTRALVPLADGCEEMEAVIIIDTLRRAGWEVVAAGMKAGEVQGSRGVRLLPDTLWDDVDPAAFDLIVLPGGGGGTDLLKQDERVVGALRGFRAAGKTVAAVCAGPLVLQAAGLLEGYKATCHPSVAEELTTTEWQSARVVVDRGVITSQGPGTSFAFALQIIAEIDGEQKADEVGRAMVVASA